LEEESSDAANGGETTTIFDFTPLSRSSSPSSSSSASIVLKRRRRSALAPSLLCSFPLFVLGKNEAIFFITFSLNTKQKYTSERERETDTRSCVWEKASVRRSVFVQCRRRRKSLAVYT
jgi:hypothetical protein